MSLCIENLPYRPEIPPATPSHQYHLKSQRSAPDLPPQDYHSQDDMPSPNQQHLERASSAQDLQSQGHQLQYIPPVKGPQLDPRTVKRFEELARDFAEQDTIEDILNWNQYLLEQLKDKHLVDKYNAWSEEYFKPQPRVDNMNAPLVFSQLKSCLSCADWNEGNGNLDVVSSMMLYGHRLPNKGLFTLGTFQRFWLILRLHMWAISPQKTDPQSRKLHGVADSQPGEVLGLRYKPIGDESTTSVLFFFPLGYILYTEAFKSDSMPWDDVAQWMDVAEWKDIPYILALGIQDHGRTDFRDDGEDEFYFIHNPTYNSDISHTPTEDSDDDAQDIIFCQNPPPYTVARVKERPKEFLNSQLPYLRSTTNIDLEPLSVSRPEIVETSMTQKRPNGRRVRVGLFPK